MEESPISGFCLRLGCQEEEEEKDEEEDAFLVSFSFIPPPLLNYLLGPSSFMLLL